MTRIEIRYAVVCRDSNLYWPVIRETGRRNWLTCEPRAVDLELAQQIARAEAAERATRYSGDYEVVLLDLGEQPRSVLDWVAPSAD